MNPYDNNPFETDTQRETRSEYDANRYLVDACEQTAKDIKQMKDHHCSDLSVFDYGYACGAQMALERIAFAVKLNTLDRELPFIYSLCKHLVKEN